ncbi:MAG: hypothetical protein COT73_10465 [Bdellovibrio sp. CG10_big_fil_rev_8_21_14_0_10_47_8]|nr:MAG: hypothetical protein COT73_10465 [Bdellovibrio sp. CG10_big_fil_rev_8_21_14_0_10_47_8]
MKTQTEQNRKLKLAAMLMAAMLLSAGCASKKDGGGSDDTAAPGGQITSSPTTPSDTDASRGTTWSSGATAALDVDLSALNSYAASHPINNPKDVRISVKLFDAGGNKYAGKIMISYLDNGQYFTGSFQAEDTVNASKGNAYPGVHQAVYNKWFMAPTSNARGPIAAKYAGKNVFHGFYEDSLGAVMIIATDSADQGDGVASNEVSGEIWFKNYANSSYPDNDNNGNVPCWFETQGPYDCRTFLTYSSASSLAKKNGELVSTSAVLPTESLWYTSLKDHYYNEESPQRGWRKLGTFTGLNRAKAFTQ